MVVVGVASGGAYLKGMGLSDLASAWTMARGLSEGYEHDGPGVCLGDGQTEAYLKDMDMTGLASAWAMARRRSKEYRHKVLAFS